MPIVLCSGAIMVRDHTSAEPARKDAGPMHRPGAAEFAARRDPGNPHGVAVKRQLYRMKRRSAASGSTTWATPSSRKPNRDW